jgi:hypothetical protein
MNNKNINIYVSGDNFNPRNIREVVESLSPGTAANVQAYDLSQTSDFTAFGVTYGASEHFAYAVILSVFDYVELDDLRNLKSKLLEELPPITDDEGKVVAVRQNPYLPINSVLQVIKGKQFITESGEKCVGLGDTRPAALENLWKQFPTLRDNIARWLLAVSGSFEYRTNFDAFQVSSAFFNVMRLDFTAGMRHLFQKLYSQPEKYWLLGHIALALYNDKSYREKILPYITEWMVSESNWLWKSAFYVYGYIEKGNENDDFDEKTRQSMEYRFISLTPVDKRYIGLLLIYSERLRTLIIEILNNLITKTQVYNEKVVWTLTYVNLLRYGYYSVSAETPACPLLACDTKTQLMNVQPLITAVLLRYQTRRLFFSIVEAYLKEISDYAVDEKTMKHIKAYFSVMAANNPCRADDILLFLRKCGSPMADTLISIVETKSNA